MKSPRFTVRDWIYVAVFGALWGVLEITLGSYLHVLFPPLADTFVVGLIMAGLGAIIALVGRWFVPKRWAVLAIGVITTILKAFSLSGVVIGPMVAILAEAILMEFRCGCDLLRRGASICWGAPWRSVGTLFTSSS